MRSVALFGLCIALFAIIGTIDWLTGTQLRIFPLYFIPIMTVASRMSRRYALVTAVASTAVWLAANTFVNNDAKIPTPIQLLNGLTMFIAFALVALLFAQLRMQLVRERESSRTDTLTGLPNRRNFMERAGVLLAASQRANRPLTLAYIDLDHFKTVNDTHGHAAGDDALRTMAELLRTKTRVGDVVARLGGDEFAALFPSSLPTRRTRCSSDCARPSPPPCKRADGRSPRASAR